MWANWKARTCVDDWDSRRRGCQLCWRNDVEIWWEWNQITGFLYVQWITYVSFCAGVFGNLRYTITQRTGIHVFLNIRNIPYFSTVVTLCCHTSQDLSYMLNQHHPTSLWTHLGHSSRVFVSQIFKKTFWASQRIWVLDSWILLNLEPWGCPKETLSRDFWENLCRATQQMSLMYGAQIDGSRTHPNARK